MGGESVERLMEIILQMKINMAHINETLQQQTYEICRELTAIFNDQKNVLDGYLGAIDAKLTECSSHVDDYRRLCVSLAEVQAKLERLGAPPSPLPARGPSENLEGMVAWRLNELREQGKI